jgi:hypothetical protein
MTKGLPHAPALAPVAFLRAPSAGLPLIALCLIAAAGLAALILRQTFWPLHAGLIVAGVACLIIAGRAPRRVAPEPHDTASPGRSDGPAFALFAALCVTLYFFLSWPDADDAFYVNLPVGMKEAAFGVMAGDTMLGAGAPLLMSTYRAEALPALAAVISALTGAPAIIAAHAILPAWLALVFAATAYALFRPTFGRDWLFAATLTLAAFFIFGGSLPSFGAHGLTRLYHGKAALLMIAAPLIAALAYCAMRLKSRAAIGFLAAVMIAGVGFTANAIYVGPLAAGLVVAAFFLDPAWRGRAWAFATLAAAAHPALVAAAFILFDPPTADSQSARNFISAAFWSQFPEKAHLAAAIGLLAFGLAAPLTLVNGRRVGLYAIAALVFLLNPYLWDLYAEKVTGLLNYRLFWAIPIPFLFAAAGATLARAGRPAALAVVALAIIGLLAPQSMLAAGSGTQFGFSLRKVDHEAYAAAARANSLVGRGETVLAAAPAAAAVAMFEGHARPVYTRRDYLDVLTGRWDAGQTEPRKALADWVNGKVDGAALRPAEAALARLLDAMCVGIIVLDSRAPDFAPRRDAALGLGADEAERSGPFVLLRRTLQAPGCDDRE